MPHRHNHSPTAEIYVGKGDTSWEHLTPPNDRVVVTTDIAVDHMKRNSDIFDSSEGSVPTTFYRPEDV